MDTKLLDECLPGVWAGLAQHMSTTLGGDVELGKRISEVWTSGERSPRFAADEPVYVANLGDRDGVERGWVLMSPSVAIAAGGVLVMKPHSAIEERIQVVEFDGDDLDAAGEFVNQVTSPLNTAITDDEGAISTHYVFESGNVEASFVPAVSVVMIGGEIKIAGQFEGVFWFLIPISRFERLQDWEPKASEARLAATAPSTALSKEDVDLAGSESFEASLGVELTREELDAIREVTAESLVAQRCGRVLVVVPVDRERAAWTALLQSAGVEYTFVGDAASLRRALRPDEETILVVDADSCSGGGVPILRSVRDDARYIGTVMVASSPTRKHVVTCLAAGVDAYLPKPLDPQELVAALENNRTTRRLSAM